MDQCSHQPDMAVDSLPAHLPGQASHEPAALRLVSGRLALAAPGAQTPVPWQQAMDQLFGWLGLRVEPTAPAQSRSLKQVAKWAFPAGDSAAAPVFEPWSIWSPTQLQAPAGRPLLPRASWVASYLFDTGTGRPPAHRPIDLMLLSPHPDACTPDDSSGSALPRTAVLTAMIAAARAEGRSRLAILVPTRCRNSLAMQLLAADRALTRDDMALEILSIEEAIGLLLESPLRWDAIITLPEQRSILFALLSETLGVSGPWPMLWHDRGLVRVTGEALDESARPAPSGAIPLDSTLLIHALALAAWQAGLGHSATRLHQAWGRLRMSGVATPGRPSPAPYANEVDEAAFIELVATDMAHGHRAAPDWKALPAGPTGIPSRPPVQLSLVSGG